MATIPTKSDFARIGDVAVPTSGEFVKVPSGGAAVIASGTYTGAGTFNGIDFPVGKKMPKKDFIFKLYAPSGTEFNKDSDYKICEFYCPSLNTQYDLSADSNNCPATTLRTYPLMENGAQVGTVKVGGAWNVYYVRAVNLFQVFQSNAGYDRIKRDADGFYVKVENWGAQYILPSGMTYNWELLYIGSDPANDIVEVA